MVALRKKLNPGVFIILGLLMLLLILSSATGCSKKLTQSQQSGYQAFKQYCVSCHIANGEGAETGIDLSKVGSFKNKNWLTSFLKNPKTVNPSSNMPVPSLSDQQIDEISDYLTTLK